MIKKTTIDHHIQKHIMSVLQCTEIARFRDMRPPCTDTNVYSYHLKQLVQRKFVEKIDGGYRLRQKGMLYVDRMSGVARTQPKIVTMLVLQNPNGDVLLYKRNKQPFAGTWSLPYGKIHIDDQSILAAAQREAREKLAADEPLNLTHAGDCYIRSLADDDVVLSTLCHVFYGEVGDIPENEKIQWARPHKLAQYRLAPAVEEIVTRAFFRDPYFFEEYMHDWTAG